MGKTPTIDSIFKRKGVASSQPTTILPITEATSTPDEVEQHILKSPRIDDVEFDKDSFERDPGLRMEIWKYNVNQIEEVRRAYLDAKAFQPIMKAYKWSGEPGSRRRFKKAWFDIFKSWLEYSVVVDAAFCLYCYVFHKPGGHHGQSTFAIGGFKNWWKVRSGKDCPLMIHQTSLLHRNAVDSCKDLRNQPQHIERVWVKSNTQQVSDNRLRLQTSIDILRFLAHQGCALRGHRENKESDNRGNFLELRSLLAAYNEKIANVIERGPHNATYTSPQSQKEILHILALNIKKAIRDEIGEAKFCIIIDEARDQSKKEQMAIILRFVDKPGLIQERFFGLVHVKDTVATTLKNGIFKALSHHNLNTQNIRGQGYDGASNMRGEWKGLQALVSTECPYAYYIHCFAHRLQLALVATCKEVILVEQFFSKLTFVINIVSASCKRSDELKAAQCAEIDKMIFLEEVETGKGKNQIGCPQRAGDTRWGSHLRSISSLLKMYKATLSVLSAIVNSRNSCAPRAEADTAYQYMQSFEFVFVMHLMKEIMENTDMLSQVLQRESLDILNAMQVVSNTKKLLQKMRDDGWDSLISKINYFCTKHDIEVPDMNASYVERGGRARHQAAKFTNMHYYHIDIYTATLDFQMQELNYRFNDNSVKLLTLSSALDPQNGLMSINVDDVCQLANEFYPLDFTDDEKDYLRIQLKHYEVDVLDNQDFRKLSTISELCKWLADTRKSTIYPLIDRLIRLVLTLPVSTASAERAFSAMSIVKSRLRNRMEDEFLSDYLCIYIEKEIASKFTTETLIDDFRDACSRRVEL